MIKKDIVLLVINCLQGGGAERSVLTLGQGFHDLGFEVHILRFKPKVEYQLSPDLHFHLVDFAPYRKLGYTTLTYRIFAQSVDKYVKKNIGIPILTLANLDNADRVMRYSRLPNIAHVIRNTISKKMLTLKKKRMSKSVLSNVYSKHPCVCISHGVEQDFRETLNIKNTTTIYNPVDREQIIELAAEPIDDLLKTVNYIVHVGSFKAQKAHDVLIKAYAKTSMTLPLVLIGKGKLMETMQRLVESMGIKDKVIFIGFKKNPYPYIKNAKFLVLSSNFEGFGRVIAESIVVDTPVISTDCPSGPSELLPNDNLVTVGDINALAQKLEDAMIDATPFKINFDESLLPVNIAKQYLKFMDVSYPAKTDSMNKGL